jgi:DNA primase
VAGLWRSNPSRDRETERVKDASDIVRVIGESISLRPKGREYAGLCPFHDDHTPSMYVVPAKQIYKCFVCGSAGDVFDFVMRFHKMDFVEAKRYLAERAGITLEPPRRAEPGAAPAGPSRTDLLSACATATEFFRGVLAHPEHGRTARALIDRRGITPAMADRFMLGASPDRWDGLVLTLRARGLDPVAFVDAALLRPRESDGGLYDAFRNRLMFPIQDQVGRVIAFGARRLNEEEDPKYINSSDTRLFNKSATLYALAQASREIQARRTAVVTEGYTDAIACHQAGIGNVVATLGTALTREHGAVLRRMCDRVVLLFDGDEAGARAADRAVEVFFAEPLDVCIATLSGHTDAKDPDELLKRPGGREVLERVIAQARDVLDYRFARVRARLAGAGISATSRAIEEELEWMGKAGLADVPPVRQRLIIRHLAGVAGVDEGTIARVIPAGRSGRAAPPAPEREARAEDGGESSAEAFDLHTRPLEAREHLLGCVLCDPGLLGTLGPDAAPLLAPEGYRSGLLARLAHVVGEVAGQGGSPDLSGVLLAVGEDADLRRSAVVLASRIDEQTERDPVRLRQHWDSCVTRARLDGSRVEAKPGADLGEAIERIRQRQAMHAALGADRRVLPRPG